MFVIAVFTQSFVSRLSYFLSVEKRKSAIEHNNGNDLCPYRGSLPRSQAQLQVLMHVFAVWG